MMPEPTSPELARLRELYAQGQYRSALAAAEPFGPLRQWQAAPARLFAGRLAMQLGAPRLGRKLHASAYRSTPSNLEAVYYHARYRLERYGPLSAIQFMATEEDWGDASPDLRADWLALKAFVASRVRDFDRAEKFLTQAEKLAPQRAWLRVERAAVMEAADRPDEALAAAEQAMELQAWFRPAVQAKAHLLTKRGSFDAAVTFLNEAATYLESGVVVAQLAALQIERQDFASAKINLDRYEELAPLLEREGQEWLAARRADVFYGLGLHAESKLQAEKAKDDFYTAFAERLAANPVDIGSSRLKDFDCSGTNTPHQLLARFWNQPLPHPLTKSHASDGLPDAAERKALEAAGWHVVEFTLTDTAAQSLLAARIPFLVSLVEVGVTQQRVAIGYDALRQSVHLADGSEPKPNEAPLAALLKRYAATGPRCLVALPNAEKHKLPSVELRDRAAWNRLHVLQAHILKREFTEAKQALDEMRRNHGKDRHTKWALLAWARGTAHPVLTLDAVNLLLADHPNDATLTMLKASALRELGRSDERLAWLKQEAWKAEPEPLMEQSLAQVLLADDLGQDDATYLLRKSLRSRPQAAAGYYLLASQAWEHQRFPQALEWYRMASCLDEREEQFADAYYRVARTQGQMPEALRLLQQRAARTETPQPAAVRVLFRALEDSETDAAFAMLDKAVEKLAGRHDAFEVEAYRAETHANYGRHEKAHDFLMAMPGAGTSGEWHRLAAKLARLRPDLAAARDHTKAALAIDPLWADGQRNLIALTLEIDGFAAARDLAGSIARHHPLVYPLVRMRSEFLTPHTTDDGAVRATKELLELCPHDAWARRQLALVLADRQYSSEAKNEIDVAATYEPTHPSQYAVMAHVHRRDDRIDAALDTYRAAIRHSVDNDLAVSELVNLSRGRAEKRSALKFIREQLHLQPHTGDGLVAYRDATLSLAANDDADDNAELIEDLHADLEKHLDERPDLWQAWSLEIQQLGLMQRLEESASLAREAVARFPLMPHLWADLARVQGVLGQSDERIESLKHALSVAPSWSPASLELSDALNSDGDEAEAIEVLRRGVRNAPTDATMHVALADRLWTRGDTEEALALAERAVRLDPGFDPAWRLTAHWCEKFERPDQVLDLARELTKLRPGDPRGWLRLARALHDPGHTSEVLAALETVIRLDPSNVEAHDLKAERLAELGQFDSALAAATPAELKEELVLQGRAAWVEAKRGNYPAAIPPMQKLVAVEPEYFWGWQQLAEWYNETGRVENFLEASSEMVRLKPEHPLPLTMRGEAKLKTGDRAGGKEDLREALRMAAQYAPAAALLFDACLADAEYHDARKALAVLQEHAVGVEVLTKQIQLACRTNDVESAMRALNEIAETPGDHPPIALQVALVEIAEAEWESKASRVLKDAWQSGGAFNPWAAVYWLDTPDGESSPYEERIAALDATIAQYPSFAAAYDRKAEMLALVGKFDDAMTACHPTAFDGNYPVTLRGRAAWVEARRGKRSQAITLMAAAVAHDPGYLWGWRNLAQWYDAEGRHRDCHDAADNMVRLAPDDALAYGYRGEARRILGDRKGAREDFAKAFELDPDFEAAGLQLITEQLQSRDAESAAATLAKLKEKTSGPLLTLRGIEVAAARGNLEAARTQLGLLLEEPRATPSMLADGVTALDDAGWAHEADEELAAVAERSPTPGTGALWAERHLRNDQGQRVLDALPGLFTRAPAAGRAAVLAYAAATAKAGRADAAAAAVHKFADALRSDDAAWAAAGAALSGSGLHALAVNWLSDWKSRENVEPMMLAALVDSLRALDRDHDALAVCRDALDLGGEAPPEFAGWLALAAASEGRTTDAAQHIASIEKIGLPDGTRLLVAIAEALVMVQQAGPDAKAAAFAEAKDHLKAASGACLPKDIPPGLSRWYRRAVKRLTQDSGLFAAKLWSLGQKLRPWVRDAV